MLHWWNLHLRTQGFEKPENSITALFCADFFKDTNIWASSLIISVAVNLFNVRNKLKITFGDLFLLHQFSTYFTENSDESNTYLCNKTSGQTTVWCCLLGLGFARPGTFYCHHYFSYWIFSFFYQRISTICSICFSSQRSELLCIFEVTDYGG